MTFTPDEFSYQSNLLYFIKGFKDAPLAQLPPLFFTMVNTVAVCLMVTSSEGLEKIKRLVNYWMLKIEEEEFGDDEYDYPKYLLRTTLCNLLSGLSKPDECLRVANLNIKEVSGDVRTYLPRSNRRTVCFSPKRFACWFYQPFIKQDHCFRWVIHLRM